MNYSSCKEWCLQFTLCFIFCDHYSSVIMSAMASQITSLTIVYSTVYSGADQWKHQSSTSLTFVWGIHRWPVNSPHKWPVTRKQFPFDDVIVLHFVSFCCDFTVRTSTHIIRITPQANVICPVIGKQPWWLRADKWYESIKNCKYNPNKAKWYKCMGGHIGGKRDVNAVRQHLELDASFALIHRYFNGCTAFH